MVRFAVLVVISWVGDGEGEEGARDRESTHDTIPTAANTLGKLNMPSEMVSAIMIIPHCHQDIVRYLRLASSLSLPNGSDLRPEEETLAAFSTSNALEATGRMASVLLVVLGKAPVSLSEDTKVEGEGAGTSSKEGML